MTKKMITQFYQFYTLFVVDWMYTKKLFQPVLSLQIKTENHNLKSESLKLLQMT